MALPPLAHTPNLSRLLGPEERIVYTAKLHPIHGLGWLAGSMVFVALAARFGILLGLPALVFLWWYLLPFLHTEIAVTTHRLLLRRGQFKVNTYAINAATLDHFQLHQTSFSILNHYGTVILNLDTEEDMRKIEIRQLWHPMTFLEALTTLNPLFQFQSVRT